MKRAILRRWQVGGQPIFVTGHGRSGTTWVGNTLAKGARTLYYFEPASPVVSGIDDASVWFRYLRSGDNDPIFQQVFDDTFAGLPYRRSWKRSAVHRLLPGYRLVVKDVAALLSAEFISQRYHPKMIIIVRHPCATVLSEIRQGIDPQQSKALLLAQKTLFEDYLEPFRAHIVAADSPLEIFSAIWAARYYVVAAMLARNPSWYLLRYETLCENPSAEFKRLFTHCGLPWSDTVASYVTEASTAEKPGMYSGVRVSARQPNKWRKEMSPAQIMAVQETIAPFNLPFYNE